MKGPPKVGQTLRYRNWTIEALAVSDGQVKYKAVGPSGEVKEGQQSIEKWQSWAKDAKKHVEECVVIGILTAPCMVCSTVMDGPHLYSGIY